MDHLKWDSGAYEEYMASLKKLERCLEEETSTLSRAQRILTGQTVPEGTDALHRIAKNLDARVKEASEMARKVHRLRSALENATEAFSAAERNNVRLGSDMLYQDVIRNTAVSQGQPYYAVFHGGISNGQIVPGWIRELAGDSGNRS